MATIASGDISPALPALSPSAGPDARENPRGQTLALTLLECAAIMAPTCETGEHGSYSHPPGVSPFICDNLVRFGLWRDPLDHAARRFAHDFIRALGVCTGSCSEFAHVGDARTTYDPARQCARVAFLLFASDLAAEWGDDLSREIIAEAQAGC